MEDLRRLKNRIDWFCDEKVNAFSPTISPAPKSVERNEIESIYEAYRYFYDKGVREIIVQRKYMGSYCDIYLKKNLNDTYFASRNGYVIKHIDLDAAKEACRELHARFDWTDLELVIIQSELMPWITLGKGLIESEFGGYVNVHKNHHEYLAGSGLYKKIAEVKQSQAYTQYFEDKKALSNKEFKAKYPSHIMRQYDAIEKFRVLDLDVYKQSIDIYEAQFNHFGRAEEISFKPFNILKKVYTNEQEEFVNDNMSYSEVNNDEYLYFTIDTEDELELAIAHTYQWFAELSANMEEGIVIKPRQAFIDGMPPAFKVRNNNYLVMIYGVDFYDRYDYYLNKRNIRRKFECSVNDWALNKQILSVKYNEIDKENYYLKNLVFDRIMGERAESTLDSRL